MSAPRSRLSAVLRFVGSVLMVSGVLLLADVAITLAWQEPLSALSAARQQDALENDLEEQTQAFGSATPETDASDPAESERRSRAMLAAAAREYAGQLEPGRAFGRIRLPTIDASSVVVEGTDPAALRKGPGHYPDTGLPGQRRTVAVAGHRTTYGAPFGNLDQLDRGDRITLEMPYGKFDYEVSGSRIVNPDATWVTDRGPDQLVLTTCHPPFSAAQRLVIFAELVGGAR